MSRETEIMNLYGWNAGNMAGGTSMQKDAMVPKTAPTHIMNNIPNHRLMNIYRKATLLSLLCLTLHVGAREITYRASAFGIVPNTSKSQSAAMQRAIASIRAEAGKGDKVVLCLEEGRYDFYPEDAASREYYISNHDQHAQRPVGLPLEDLHDFTLDGQGAQLVFHGRMLPLSLVRSERCTLKDFSIDFDNPHITQITVVENDEQRGISFVPAPWVEYDVTPWGDFVSKGEGWHFTHRYGMAFEGGTRHIVYRTSDLSCPIGNVEKVGTGDTLRVASWKDKRLPAGTVIALRGWERPSPGIFMTHCKDTRLLNLRVHYAEGMGLLAQLCEDIDMQGFGVCLKGDKDPRYFTTQADATHFSSCRGAIRSTGGLYEGMMDDAINVHGTYLKVMRRLDDHTLEARYMHAQSWGFDWGFTGDKVQFVRSSTMERLMHENRIEAITPLDAAAKEQGRGMDGARTFRIRFRKPLPKEVSGEAGFGIENMSWTPSVYFAGNTIRNNRARGALFSTPCKVLVEDNLFDHTSGCAILLCGDCNGWYETGACRKVTIRRNRFINALTSEFQFTNAVISIYPEIPDLEHQKTPFHGGRSKAAISIKDNVFNTFDRPILYAKSVDGLLFRGNTITSNNDYPPFHWNRNRFLLQHVSNVNIENILYDHSGLILKEIRLE